jgi:hypothetical protein
MITTFWRYLGQPLIIYAQPREIFVSFSQQVEAAVIESLVAAFETMDGAAPEIDADTVIIGENSAVISATFVFFLVGLEEKLEEITGESIILTEHPDAFEEDGPFCSVQTLVHYINSTHSEP